jgi:hypothetical protein
MKQCKGTMPNPAKTCSGKSSKCDSHAIITCAGADVGWAGGVGRLDAWDSVGSAGFYGGCIYG